MGSLMGAQQLVTLVPLLRSTTPSLTLCSAHCLFSKLSTVRALRSCQQSRWDAMRCEENMQSSVAVADARGSHLTL